MAQTVLDPAKPSSFRVSASSAYTRLIEELAVASRQLNRSKIVRDALVEKADRELAANWREVVGLEPEADAA